MKGSAGKNKGAKAVVKHPDGLPIAPGNDP